MRIVKIGVWMFIMYILQTAFGKTISINGASPSLIAVFSVMFSFLTPNDREALYVTVISAVLAGSCVGRVFPFEVLAVGAGSVGARALVKYLRFIPQFIRLMVIVLVFSAALITGGFFLENRAIGINAVLYRLIPSLVYTMVCACIMYPIMQKTLVKKTEKKLLVI